MAKAETKTRPSSSYLARTIGPRVFPKRPAEQPNRLWHAAGSGQAWNRGDELRVHGIFLHPGNDRDKNPVQRLFLATPKQEGCRNDVAPLTADSDPCPSGRAGACPGLQAHQHRHRRGTQEADAAAEADGCRRGGAAAGVGGVHPGPDRLGRRLCGTVLGAGEAWLGRQEVAAGVAAESTGRGHQQQPVARRLHPRTCWMS